MDATINADEMSKVQATDEAILLFFRRGQRLHPEAFASVWASLPEGARSALLAAERRADVVRDRHGVSGLAWPSDSED